MSKRKRTPKLAKEERCPVCGSENLYLITFMGYPFYFNDGKYASTYRVKCDSCCWEGHAYSVIALSLYKKEKDEFCKGSD